jgi:hypothetical protein
MKLLSACCVLAAAFMLTGCGGGTGGDASAGSDSPEASVRQASEDFINAAIHREGDKVCDLSSQTALAKISTEFPAVAADCDKGMEELFSKLPESAIEKDEDFVEHLPEAEVKVEGDRAYVTGVGTDLEFVLANGNCCSTTPKKSRPRKNEKTRSKNEKKKNSKNGGNVEKKKSAGKYSHRNWNRNLRSGSRAETSTTCDVEGSFPKRVGPSSVKQRPSSMRTQRSKEGDS